MEKLEILPWRLERAGSTCSTNRCKCRKAGNNCLNCICLVKCTNHGSPGLSCDSEAASSTASKVTPRPLDYVENKEKTRDKSNETSTAKKDTAQLQSDDESGDEQEEIEVETVFPIGDLPGAEVSAADLKLMDVYGDYIHQNDGSHLDGGIKDDAVWQARWAKLIVLPAQRYNAPGGPVGR